MLTPGSVLGDRYRLARRIAVGGMGEVWRADDTLLHRAVAVKVLKPELSQDATFVDRFRNEARSAAAFSHSGIANVYDYGEAVPTGGSQSAMEPAIAYLVMELVDGRPLAEILAHEGRLSVHRTLDYVGQAAAALQVAHRVGVVHRDIKPGNMLVTADDEVKITDFGIARAASTVPLTQAGMVMGTAQYFSPEQAEGRAVGPPSDVYSLGVVAYECLTGRLPFIADSPVTVAMMQIRNLPPPLPPDIPAAVRGTVERAMAKDPTLRYANGGELAGALAAAREGRFDPGPAFVAPAAGTSGDPVIAGWAPIGPGPPAGPSPLAPTARPAGPPPGPPPSRPPAGPPPHPGPGRRRRNVAIAVATLLIAAVAASLLVWYFATRDGDPSSDPSTSPSVAHVGRTAGQGTPSPASSTPGLGDGSGDRPLSAPTTRDPASGSTGAASTDHPKTVLVDPQQLVGRPISQVQDELQSRGLRTTVVGPWMVDPRHNTVTALRYPRDHLLSRPTRIPAGATISLDTTPHLGDNDQLPGEGHNLVQASSNPQGDR